jgi:hypothetical protein
MKVDCRTSEELEAARLLILRARRARGTTGIALAYSSLRRRGLTNSYSSSVSLDEPISAARILAQELSLCSIVITGV